MFILTCIVVAVMMHVAASSNSMCTKYDGICQNTNITCDGNYSEGMCIGETDTQCCLPGDHGANGTIGCTNAECHKRCRNGNAQSRLKSLTGYCKFSISELRKICTCSYDCRKVDNSAVKCLALCIEKGFKNGVCCHIDRLCCCGP